MSECKPSSPCHLDECEFCDPAGYLAGSGDADPSAADPHRREESAAPSGDGPVTGPRLIEHTMSAVTPERVSWLWPGYLARGKLHLLDGDPGLGKSTVALDLAARLSVGASWPDGQPGAAPARAVILSAEDGLADTIRPRLDAAGADCARIVAVTAVRTPILTADGVTDDDRLPTLPGDAHRLRDLLHRTGAELLIIDPLMAYLGPDVNAHKDQDVRRALNGLVAALADTSTAAVVIRHMSKAGGANPIYRGGGSIGIIGAARAAFIVAPDPADDGQVVIACSKINIAVAPASLAFRLSDAGGCAQVQWADKPVSYTATDLLAAGAETTDERDERDWITEWLIRYLIDNGSEATAGDATKAGEKVGIPARSLRRARARSGCIRKEKRDFTGPWIWIYDPSKGPSDDPKGSKGSKGQEDRTGVPFALRVEADTPATPSARSAASTPSPPAVSPSDAQEDVP